MNSRRSSFCFTRPHFLFRATDTVNILTDSRLSRTAAIERRQTGMDTFRTPRGWWNKRRRNGKLLLPRQSVLVFMGTIPTAIAALSGFCVSAESVSLDGSL